MLSSTCTPSFDFAACCGCVHLQEQALAEHASRCDAFGCCRDGRERHGPTQALRCAGRPGRRQARPYKTLEGSSLFGGLDTQQWSAFVSALNEGVRTNLAEGSWKQAAAAAGKPAGLGVSCPHLR